MSNKKFPKKVLQYIPGFMEILIRELRELTWDGTTIISLLKYLNKDSTFKKPYI